MFLVWTCILTVALVFSAVGLGSWCFHMTLKYEMQVSIDKSL